MPKSKRNKQVSLTKVTKKGLPFKQKLFEQIQSHVENFSYIYLIKCSNVKNVQLKELREEWKPSKFLFCKNSLVSVAFGKSIESEYKEGLSILTNKLQGQCGLLFTDKTPDIVSEYFQNFSHDNFARYKLSAPKTIVISQGVMPDLSHAHFKYLENLSLPVKLEKNKIIFTENYTLCVEGEKLTIDQAKLLKLFNKPVAQFKIAVLGYWSAEEASYVDM